MDINILDCYSRIDNLFGQIAQAKKDSERQKSEQKKNMSAQGSFEEEIRTVIRKESDTTSEITADGNTSQDEYLTFEQRLEKAFPNDNIRVEVLNNAAYRNTFKSRGEALGPKDLSVFIPADVMNKAAKDPVYAQQVVDNIIEWKNDYDARDYACVAADGYNIQSYANTTSHAFLLDENGKVEDFAGTSTGWLPEDMNHFNRSVSNHNDSEQAKRLRKKRLQKRLEKEKLEELLAQERHLQKRLYEIRLENNMI